MQRNVEIQIQINLSDKTVNFKNIKEKYHFNRYLQSFMLEFYYFGPWFNLFILVDLKSSRDDENLKSTEWTSKIFPWVEMQKW